MKSSKLSKLKMPERKKPDLAELESEDSMEMEEPEELALEGAEEQDSLDAELPEAPAPSDLDSLSDDELLAELKKRGLMGKLDEEKSEDEEELLA